MRINEIVVYCDAESHENGPWERTYASGAFIDGVRTEDWEPDFTLHLDKVGGREFGPRHDYGMFVRDEQGRVVNVDDVEIELAPGADPPFTHPLELVGFLHRQDGYSAFFVVRCPECGDGVRRSHEHLNQELDWLAEHGQTRISIPGLRALRRVLDRLDEP